METLLKFFKTFNRFMLLMWRLGLGRWVNFWPKVVGQILVLTTTGRKTGLSRRTPVNYAVVDGEIYCTAGFGQTSDWFRNLKSNPQVEVWLPDGWWAGTAEEVNDPQLRLPLMRQVLIGSGFAAFTAGINPYRIDDEQLAAITSGYRLVRIRRAAARTGPGGPGDMAWVWPLAVFLLLPLALRRNRAACCKKS
jgi:deazaflavin-dependent oxidoreductase (nitroreductase family)